VSTWTGERVSSAAKASEPIQKMQVPVSTAYFKKGKGKMIDVDNGDDDLPEL